MLSTVDTSVRQQFPSHTCSFLSQSPEPMAQWPSSAYDVPTVCLVRCHYTHCLCEEDAMLKLLNLTLLSWLLCPDNYCTAPCIGRHSTTAAVLSPLGCKIWHRKMLQLLASTLSFTSKKLQYQRHLLSNPTRAKGWLSARGTRRLGVDVMKSGMKLSK